MKNKLILLIAMMTFLFGTVSAQSDYFIVSKDGTRIHIQ